MLTAQSIFNEIRRDDRAYQFLLSVAAKGEAQGGWENERIAELTGDPVLAGKIRRHGEDESKHGRLFTTLLRKRGLQPGEVPAGVDYCMLLERQGIGLSHARLRQDAPLSDEEIIRYLAHSRVTEQRSTEEMALQLRLFGNDPELKRTLAMIADDEANHLSYCHEELLRFDGMGYRRIIAEMLQCYALVEIRVYRDVSLAFIDRMAELLSWSSAKRALLRLGVCAVWVAERGWGWRRMVRLAPPERPGAMDTAMAARSRNAFS